MVPLIAVPFGPIRSPGSFSTMKLAFPRVPQIISNAVNEAVAAQSTTPVEFIAEWLAAYSARENKKAALSKGLATRHSIEELQEANILKTGPGISPALIESQQVPLPCACPGLGTLSLSPTHLCLSLPPSLSLPPRPPFAPPFLFCHCLSVSLSIYGCSLPGLRCTCRIAGVAEGNDKRCAGEGAGTPA